ncbi:hypothetical protein DIPPA_18085 [Diplonema papillatum]|nr:hypothetical protein DIPPA_18085 [Diplonema papillatum]
MASIPEVLVVTSPNVKGPGGAYKVTDRVHNGVPVWKQDTGTKVIFMSTMEKWLIGKEEMMTANKGWAMSRSRCLDKAPHEVDMWQARDRVKGWEDDPGITVAPATDGASFQLNASVDSPRYAASMHTAMEASLTLEQRPSIASLATSRGNVDSVPRSPRCGRCPALEKELALERAEREAMWQTLESKKDEVAELKAELGVLRAAQEPTASGIADDLSQHAATVVQLQDLLEEERRRSRHLGEQLGALKRKDATRDNVGAALTSKLLELTAEALIIAQRQVSRLRDVYHQVSAASSQSDGHLTSLLGCLLSNIERDALEASRKVYPGGLEREIQRAKRSLQIHRREKGVPAGADDSVATMRPTPEQEVAYLRSRVEELERVQLLGPARDAELQILLGEQQRGIADKERQVLALRGAMAAAAAQKDESIAALCAQLDAAHAAMGLAKSVGTLSPLRLQGSASPQRQRATRQFD